MPSYDYSSHWSLAYVKGGLAADFGGATSIEKVHFCMHCHRHNVLTTSWRESK